MRPRETHRSAMTARPRLEVLENRSLPSVTIDYLTIPYSPYPKGFSTVGGIDGVYFDQHWGAWSDGEFVDNVCRITPDGTTTTFAAPVAIVPLYLAPTPDGSIWYSDGDLFRLSPDGGVTRFVVPHWGPYQQFTVNPSTYGKAVAADGTLWVLATQEAWTGTTYEEEYAMVRVSLQTAPPTFTVFPLPNDFAPFNANFEMRTGPDGNVWFIKAVSQTGGSSSTQVGYIGLDGSLNDVRTLSAFADGLTTGADGNLWFDVGSHDAAGNFHIGALRLAGDGSLTEFDAPDWYYQTDQYPPDTHPVLGPDGNIWMRGGAQSLYSVSTDGVWNRIVVPDPPDPPEHFFEMAQLGLGPDGNLWFPLVYGRYGGQSYIGRLNLPTAGPISQFRVTASAPSVAGGQSFAVTVRALDAAGVQNVGYTGTVHFSSTDPLAGLPADYTFTAADYGVHTFVGVTLGTLDEEDVTATDGHGAAGSASVTVTSGAPAALRVLVPADAVAGSPFDLTVEAVDRSGNSTPGYVGTVHLTSTDPRAVLPTDYTFTAADQGVHTFHGVTLYTAGSATVSASDTVYAQAGGQGAIDVSPAAMSGFALSAPGPVTAHLPFALTVYASDAYGNAIRTYQGSVHFTSSDALAGLPGDYTFGAPDGAVHTFAGVVLHAVGTQTVSASDGTYSGGAAVAVSPLAGRFELDAPASVTAGVPFTVTLRVLDTDGNLVPAYLGRVRWTSTDPQGDPPPDYDFTADDQGVHTFIATLRTAGLVHLAAGDDGGLAGGFDISVSPGAAAALDVQLPSDLTAGVATTFTVRAWDLYGNAAAYTGTVHFSSTDPRAVLPADYTFTASDGGLHTFINGLILRTQGVQSLGVSDSGGTLTAAQGGITVGPRTAPAVIAVAGGLGDIPEVRLIDPKTGQMLLDFLAYDPRFRGGVRVAVGDTNADGVPDVVTVPGITGGADLKVWDGKTGHLLREFAAFPMAFTGGAFVAVADVNNDGYADIVAGKGPGSGPRVKVFSGKDGSLLANFLAYDPSFAGGVRVAAGDVNADGFADVITGAGPGGGPHVVVFSGKDGALLQSFFAFSPSFTGGVYVSAGDVNGDGHADIIAGSGAGGPPEVKVFSGLDRHLLADFLAYGSAFTGGVRVGAFDLDGDGRSELLTAPGQGPTHAVKVFAADQTLLDKFFAFDQTDQSGVMLGGG